MKLIDKQREFTRRVAQLIDFAYSRGYALRFGEALRTPEQAALNAKKGSGISESHHIDRLAIDLILDIDGVWQRNSEAYRPLGEFWESLSTPDAVCRWGGRWKKADGNHFSIEHNGIQ